MCSMYETTRFSNVCQTPKALAHWRTSVASATQELGVAMKQKPGCPAFALAILADIAVGCTTPRRTINCPSKHLGTP